MNFIEWISSFWWTVILSFASSFFLVSTLFEKIISHEMERGGEEYGERATTRIQKWASIIMILSILVISGVVVSMILNAFGLIHFGK